jgi:hypothetical protein
MRLTLEKKWTEALTRLPESGMGYRRVRVELRDGRTIPEALVFNSEVLDVQGPIAPFRSRDIRAIEPIED